MDVAMEGLTVEPYFLGDTMEAIIELLATH
mgnify:FL=1